MLLNNREKFLSCLRSFERVETRVIVRRTQVYGRVLQESLHPDLLRDGAEHKAFFDRLPAASLPGLSTEQLLPSERRDLMEQDVPFFATEPGSLSIWDSRGEQIRDFHGMSGMDAVRQRLQELSESDLNRQLWIIRASLQSGTATAPSVPPATLESKVHRTGESHWTLS